MHANTDHGQQLSDNIYYPVSEERKIHNDNPKREHIMGLAEDMQPSIKSLLDCVEARFTKISR